MFFTDDKDEWYDSVFMECYTALNNRGNLSTSIEPENNVCEEILQTFISCNICSHNFIFRNILHSEINGHSYYLIFVEIDLGVAFSPKSGQHDLGFEYQIWGYASLKTSYEKLLLTPKETEDNVKHFLHKIFGNAEKSIISNPHFNKKYKVEGADNEVESFFANFVIDAIEPIDNLNLVVVENNIICGFYDSISVSSVCQLDDFFRKIQLLLK